MTEPASLNTLIYICPYIFGAVGGAFCGDAFENNPNKSPIQAKIEGIFGAVLAFIPSNLILSECIGPDNKDMIIASQFLLGCSFFVGVVASKFFTEQETIYKRRQLENKTSTIHIEGCKECGWHGGRGSTGIVY